MACIGGCKEIVELLLEKDADVNHTDDKGVREIEIINCYYYYYCCCLFHFVFHIFPFSYSSFSLYIIIIVIVFFASPTLGIVKD